MEQLGERIERLVGANAVSWDARAASWQPANAVLGGNERFSVTLADGRRVFVKAAQSKHMAAWLRREHEVYAHLRGSFIPELVAFEDDASYPLLVIEDLSDADWEPRWNDERVALVRAALAELAAAAPPPNTQTLRESHPSFFGRWHAVADDPAPFLSTGIRSDAWLERNLAALAAAADAAPVDGDALLHLDVRSDNLCFRDDEAVLVDWNWCCIANADVDVAGWLPTLALEGGPKPWNVLPASGELAAWFAGIWAAVVGLPPPETAPTVRDLQRRQLEIALEWCERELGL